MTLLNIIQKENYSYGISHYLTAINLAGNYSGVHYSNGHYIALFWYVFILTENDKSYAKDALFVDELPRRVICLRGISSLTGQELSRNKCIVIIHRNKCLLFLPLQIVRKPISATFERIYFVVFNVCVGIQMIIFIFMAAST